MNEHTDAKGLFHPVLMPSGRRQWMLFLVRMAAILGLMTLAYGCMVNMPGTSYSGAFEPLTDEETALEEQLRAHVTMLGQTIGDRNIWRPHKLAEAAVYIQEQFRAAGYDVATQEYRCRGMLVTNVEVVIEGAKTPGEIVVIGAHYDSVRGCPAANDNGSGVAALLEIARLLKGHEPGRTLRLVAFVNEEPPFFQTGQMGSHVYASRCRGNKENITAMVSLETIGFYSDEKGSQKYPFPFSLLYPDTGNFIAFVGNLSSRSLVRRAIRSFREHAKFPSEGAATPGWITGVGWSDHWSFWKHGYPAIMVTDTAPFRYAHYHWASDTPDKLRYDRMARVVAGLAEVVKDLAAAD
jgi:hypothetical protein